MKVIEIESPGTPGSRLDIQSVKDTTNSYQARRCREPQLEATSPVHIVPASTKSPEDLLNQSEVAQWLGVDVSWVTNHCTRTEPILPFIQLGGGRYATRRFRREDILEFLEQHTHKQSKIKPRKAA